VFSDSWRNERLPCRTELLFLLVLKGLAWDLPCTARRQLDHVGPYKHGLDTFTDRSGVKLFWHWISLKIPSSECIVSVKTRHLHTSSTYVDMGAVLKPTTVFNSTSAPFFSNSAYRFSRERSRVPGDMFCESCMHTVRLGFYSDENQNQIYCRFPTSSEPGWQRNRQSRTAYETDPNNLSTAFLQRPFTEGGCAVASTLFTVPLTLRSPRAQVKELWGLQESFGCWDL